jgi:tRNA A-37 threonylcarbamoyl transferase component Bud32
MTIDSSNNIQLVSRVASNFLNNAEVRVAPILGRGSVNKVFLVEATDTKLAFRMGANESLEEYRKEAWCIHQAAERGVPVATVLDMGVVEERGFMIQSYIAGDEGRDSSLPRSHIWRELGKHARLIHSIDVVGFGLKLSDLTEGDSRKSWLEYLNYNIESLNENDELIKLRVVNQSESAAVRRMFEDLRGKTFDFGLNHGDLSLKNVIVDRSGKVHLLDWGSAEASIVPHHDLIQLLKMNMLENDPNDLEIQSFLDGYGISASEYEEMIPTLEILLLLRAFDKLRWAIDTRVELESYIAHARQVVERKLLILS